jgi:hypothetical protein
MHPLIGLAILIGTAAFVVFAFRQGMGVIRDRREDDIPAMGVGSDSGPTHHSGDGLGHS